MQGGQLACLVSLGLAFAACGFDGVGTAPGVDAGGADAGSDAHVTPGPVVDASPSPSDGATPDAADAAPVNAYAAAVRAKGPLVYYRFEETTGTVAADASGNAHDGTFDMVTLGAAGPSAALGRAATFTPASPSSVAVPALGSQSKLTIECWLKPNTIKPAGWNVVFNVDDFPSGAVHFQLEGYNLSNVELTVNSGGANDAFGGLVLLGQWTYLVASYDSTSGVATFYVNGIFAATSAFPVHPAANLAAGHIGAWNDGSRAFDGAIDELAIYGSVLSAADVSAHWALGKP
jgi:hypothetical protein